MNDSNMNSKDYKFSKFDMLEEDSNLDDSKYFLVKQQEELINKVETDSNLTSPINYGIIEANLKKKNF
jgi:hypothetical protein